MKKYYKYRLSVTTSSKQLSIYEIGECEGPRSYPNHWCDRKICEGFWGDENLVKRIVNMLNLDEKDISNKEELNEL